MASVTGTPEAPRQEESQTMEPSGPPPAYDGDSAPRGDSVVSPPAYDVATKLPSYAEAEQSKACEAALLPPDTQECPEMARRQERRNRRHRLFFWLDGNHDGAGMAPRDPNMSHAQLRQQVLGTELEFLCCFLIAFLFNWIGLFASLCCLTVTISGRSGAISGFGLSVVKWAFLVMHQSYVTREAFGFAPSTIPPLDDLDRAEIVEVTAYQSSLWFKSSCWIIIALGCLCFLQGLVHYARAAKRARDTNWLRQRYNGHPGC